MEYDTTDSWLQSKILGKNNRKNLANVCKHEYRQQINWKFLSIISNKHTNCYLES